MPSQTHRARARVAALSRHRTSDDAELSSARAELRTAAAEDYIRRLVEASPRLNDEQVGRLAVLLRPDPSTTGSAA